MKCLFAFVVFLGVFISSNCEECTIPGEDHWTIKSAKDCHKKSGEVVLCTLECFIKDNDFVDEKGQPKKDIIVEKLKSIPNESFRKEITHAFDECLVKKAPLKLNTNNCVGLTSNGLCVRNTLMKNCPNMVL